MTHISSIDYPDDHDYTAPGSDVLYKAIVDGQVEHGAVSLDELLQANQLILALKMELRSEVPNAIKIDEYFKEIADLANTVGDESAVIKNTLLNIAAFQGSNVMGSPQQCLDACSEAMGIINTVKPPMQEMLMLVFVYKALGESEKITQDLRDGLELTREGEAALGAMTACLNDPTCSLSEFEDAVNRLKQVSSELRGNPDYETMKGNIDKVIDDMEEYFLDGVGGSDRKLQERIQGFQKGSLMENGKVHGDLEKEAPHPFVTNSINSNLQTATTSASQLSDMGVQDYSKALSDTSRIVEITQSILSALHRAVSSMIHNIR